VDAGNFFKSIFVDSGDPVIVCIPLTCFDFYGLILETACIPAKFPPSAILTVSQYALKSVLNPGTPHALAMAAILSLACRNSSGFSLKA